jgi:hypothetical protein
MKVILLGSTGLIGKNVLTILCQDKRITQVITPVRKINQILPKQLAIQYDFEQNEELEIFHGASAVICTLGTTMALAKSKENFPAYSSLLCVISLWFCNFWAQIIINRMQTEFTEGADLTISNSGLRERITHKLTQTWRECRVEAYFP